MGSNHSTNQSYITCTIDNKPYYSNNIVNYNKLYYIYFNNIGTPDLDKKTISFYKNKDKKIQLDSVTIDIDLDNSSQKEVIIFNNKYKEVVLKTVKENTVKLRYNGKKSHILFIAQI